MDTHYLNEEEKYFSLFTCTLDENYAKVTTEKEQVTCPVCKKKLEEIENG